jgi:hypothetical protein
MLSDKDKNFIKWYESTPLVYGIRGGLAFKYWHLIRTQAYYDNKNNGYSDPLDVFDGCKGPFLIKKDKE